METGSYGPLESLARNKDNLGKVLTHWPDMLRVTSSLVTGRSARTTCCGCSAGRGAASPQRQTSRVTWPRHLLIV
ncbi:MAG: hypothetical protein QOE61_5236 [Micromonosporaceae bacterium]|nr:hypothetical protein [Micromonosporaceae bacterium]